MPTSFTEDDIGKSVETAAGDPVGVVADVEGETAYVDPESGIADSLRAALDWTGGADDPLPLASAAVGEIDDETVRLGSEYADEGESAPGEEPTYRQDETDADAGALAKGERSEADPGSMGGRQDETDLEPADPDGADPDVEGYTDPESEGFGGPDPDVQDKPGTEGFGGPESEGFGDPDSDVEGDPDDPALSDAADKIDGDRERRTDPTTDPIEEAGGSGGPETPSTESGTREDVDVDPAELTEDDGDDREDD